MEELVKHFDMSDEYANNSFSQQTIGRMVIQYAVNMATQVFADCRHIRALDIACGPGNLTLEFLHALEENFPTATIDLSGLDYSDGNVKRLVKNSESRIRGITASFYDFPPETKEQHIIISNEGLHWQPPYKTSNLYYLYLDAAERKKYEAFACKNLTTALKNIYGALNPGGIAVLQFGHEGGLRNLWQVVYEIFMEEPFKKYSEKVNFPIYYLPVENIHNALGEAGFPDDTITITSFAQDLTEDTPIRVTNLHRAVSERGYSQVLDPQVLEKFYARMEEKLNEVNMPEFRKNMWRRTLIQLHKK